MELARSSGLPRAGCQLPLTLRQENQLLLGIKLDGIVESVGEAGCIAELRAQLLAPSPVQVNGHELFVQTRAEWGACWTCRLPQQSRKRAQATAVFT